MRAPVEKTVVTNGSSSSRRLVASVVGDAQRLVTLEMALAKQEIKELALANAIAAGLVAFGGLLILLGILVAGPAIVVLLVPWHWEAAAVWAIAYLVVGFVLILAGKARFQVAVPTRTLQSLKESKEWALRRVRSNGR